MRAHEHSLPALAAALAAVLLTGCGEKPPGSALSGTVTFQGKPLDQGTIEFSPAAGQGTLSGGPIKDGKYSIPAAQGLEPGLYQVRISSSTGAPPTTDELPGEVTVPPKQRIPPEYNSETSLKAEVKATGENRFDFEIP